MHLSHSFEFTLVAYNQLKTRDARWEEKKYRQRWVLYTELCVSTIHTTHKRINKTKTTLSPCEIHTNTCTRKQTHADIHSHIHISMWNTIQAHTIFLYILRSLSCCLRLVPVLWRIYLFTLESHSQNRIQNKSICANGIPWWTLSLLANECVKDNMMVYNERDVRLDEHTSSSSSKQQHTTTTMVCIR